MVTVSFPVEAHVFKYLQRRHGSALIATKTTLLGLLVLNAMEKTYAPPEKWLERKHTYTVIVNQGNVNRVGHSLPRNTQHYLGEVCTKIFNMAMYEHLDDAVMESKQALPSLKKFLLRYGITEDDIKVETLYKAYQRHCRMNIKAKKMALN